MTILTPFDPSGCNCDNSDVAPGMLTINAALDALLDLVTPVDGTGIVPLPQASGRVLARPVRARSSTPPFDNAAMDGYALRSADLKGAGPWRLPVAGRITAGDGHVASAVPGTACRIFTGAMLPSGADTVVMQEHVIRDGDAITLGKPVTAGTNIRRSGEDMQAGDIVLHAGARLGPRQIATLAAAGAGAVAVKRRVRVALMATGDELTAPGGDLARAGIWDVNTPMLGAALNSPQVELVVVTTGRDHADDLTTQLRRLSQEVDLIVTTGGISVGEADHVKPAFLAAGGRITFSAVAIKPGKPVSAGRIGAAIWLGLPGNPLSAFVTWQIFGNAVLAGLAGQALAAGVEKRLVLASDRLSHRTGRCEARLARITGVDGMGRTVVTCDAATHSGRVVPLADADGLVLIPADAATIPQGSLLEFIPFPDH